MAREARIFDQRRRDFSIIDDEFTDDPRLRPGDRSTYLSLVRHGRMTGRVENIPTEVLMASAGMKRRETWRHAISRLESRGYITVDRNTSGLRGPGHGSRTHAYTLLPVQKSRPGVEIRGGKTVTTGGGCPPISDHSGAEKPPSRGGKTVTAYSYSETLDTREKSASRVGGFGSEGNRTRPVPPVWSDRLAPDGIPAKAFRDHHGRAPQGRGELAAWLAGMPPEDRPPGT